MKELTIEQKAKAYDWALEVLHKYDGAHIMFTQDLKEEMFPALLESEDEKIRKSLIKSFINQHSCNFPTIDGFSREQILAWLEKQDSNYTFEIKTGHWYKCVCDYMLNGSDLIFKNGRLYYCRSDWRLAGEIDERNVKDIGVNGYKSFFRPATNQEIKDWLEKQKPTDKVEPKFHEGDWTISNLDRNVRQISEVHFDEYNSYYVVNGKSVNLEEYDRLHHLWSIQDAKDGDVLTYKDSRNNVWVCIFKEYANERVYDYCTLDKESFYEHGNWNYLASFSYTPATKEQRDLLFAKMEEAGYTFDFEKKELKKIEQKPTETENTTWSEEDEKIHRKCILAMRASACGFPEEEKFVEQVDNWLKSLKDRVQPQPKREWSKEDNEMINAIRTFIVCGHTGDISASKGKMIIWLKSLRPQNRLKPSDEQMEALDRAQAELCSTEYNKPICDLIDSLNKLRGEINYDIVHK